MPNFAHEVNFWRSTWEVIKGDFEFVLCIFKEPESHKNDTMPNFVFKNGVLYKLFN